MTGSRTYAVLPARAMVLSAGATAAGTTHVAGRTAAPLEDPAVVKTRRSRRSSSTPTCRCCTRCSEEQGEPGSDLAARQERARLALHDEVRAAQAQAADAAATQAQQRAALGFAFPYDSSPEAFQSVLCADGRNPGDAALWQTHADRAEERAPDFGRLWSWASAPCASHTWWVRDEDAYRGPFTTRTVNPVLVVGNLRDPATSYDGAVTVASLLPNSRLLSSDSWGHTAYGTCA